MDERIGLALAIIVVMIGVAFAFFYYAHGKLPNVFAPPGNSMTLVANGPSNVLLSGMITTPGSGLHPTSIAFYGMNNATYSTSVVNGAYNIILPNLKTYSYVVFWAGPYKWQVGFDPIKPAVRSLALGTYNSTYTKNIQVILPNALVSVGGTVRMLEPNVSPTGIVIRSPTAIVFTSNYGNKFTATLTAGKNGYICIDNDNDNDAGTKCDADDEMIFHQGNTTSTFTTMLPNWMTYNVTIDYNGIYANTKGSCNAGTLYVDEGLGGYLDGQGFAC